MTQTENTFLAFTYNVDGEYTELRYEKGLAEAIDYLNALCETHGLAFRLSYTKITETYHINWYTRDGNKYIPSRDAKYLPAWMLYRKFGE